MKYRILILLILISFLSKTEIFAQFENAKVNLLVGFTRNFIFFNTSGESHYEISPELQVEGTLLQDALNWSVNLSYWDDNVNDISGIMDLESFYSYSDISLGARIYLISDGFIKDLSALELAFFLGVSHDFITGKNLFSDNNEFAKNLSFELNVGDTGIRVGYELHPKIKLLGEYSFKYHLSSTDYLLCDARSSFRIGVSLILGETIK